jgi:hypothetical protein
LVSGTVQSPQWKTEAAEHFRRPSPDNSVVEATDLPAPSRRDHLDVHRGRDPREEHGAATVLRTVPVRVRDEEPIGVGVPLEGVDLGPCSSAFDPYLESKRQESLYIVLVRLTKVLSQKVLDLCNIFSRLLSSTKSASIHGHTLHGNETKRAFFFLTSERTALSDTVSVSGSAAESFVYTGVTPVFRMASVFGGLSLNT